MNGHGDRQVGRILVTILAGLVLLDVGVPLVYQVSGPPTVPSTVYLGRCAAQISLHAVFVVLVRGWMMSRAVSIFALAALAAWALHRHDPAHERVLLACIFLVQWLLVAGAMLVLIVAGLRLHRFTRQELAVGIVSRPTQFSLRGLVWLVTAASVLAGVLVRLDLQQSMMLLASLFGGLFALPTILLVPSVLFARRWKWWTAFSLVAGSGAGAAMFFSMNRSWEATPLFLVPGLLTAAGLLLMRALGFRLWRPPRVLPSEALQAELLARDGAIAPNMPSAGDPEAKNAR